MASSPRVLITNEGILQIGARLYNKAINRRWNDVLFITRSKRGRAQRRNEFNSGHFLQSNISILTVGTPRRSDNAWNEDLWQNTYAHRRIAKLQAWGRGRIYGLLYTAAVFPLELSTEAGLTSIAIRSLVSSCG